MLKTANRILVIDSQDDPGDFFAAQLEPYWPEDLEPPQLGSVKNASQCLIHELDSGRGPRPAWPIDTPQDTLASAMYFFSHGSDLGLGEEGVKVASALKEMCSYWGVEIPTQFRLDTVRRHLSKSASMRSGMTQNIPDLDTEPDHTILKSVALDIGKSSADPTQLHRDILSGQAYFDDEVERLEALNKSASLAMLRGNMDVELRDCFGPMAELHVQRRLKVAHAMLDPIEADRYSIAAYRVIGQINGSGDEYERLKVAVDTLSRIEQELGMSATWGAQLPRPFDGLTDQHPDVFDEFVDNYKVASEWGNMDWEKAAGLVDPAYLDAIQSDPDTVIPSLPHEVQVALRRCKR